MFLQIEDDIIGGILAEEPRVPSTNEFAACNRIDPATAGTGVDLLVDDREVIHRRRRRRPRHRAQGDAEELTNPHRMPVQARKSARHPSRLLDSP